MNFSILTPLPSGTRVPHFGCVSVTQVAAWDLASAANCWRLYWLRKAKLGLGLGAVKADHLPCQKSRNGLLLSTL